MMSLDEMRLEALKAAIAHACRTEGAADVVSSAEVFHRFLRGDGDALLPEGIPRTCRDTASYPPSGASPDGAHLA
jgi:hypothetical protein